MSKSESSARSARTVVLPAYTLTTVCDPAESDAQLVTACVERYAVKPVTQPNSFSQRCATVSFNLMPVVLDGVGAPWAEAQLYLMSRLDGAINPAMSTFHGLADDLAAFKRYLEEHDVDYTPFPVLKHLRPTYRYRGYLNQAIQLKEVAASTAKRRMATVVGFYRWLVSEGLIVPANQPWVEGDAYISYKDNKGFEHSKHVATTDVAIRTPKQDDPYAETITDGGDLRPLPEDEQLALLEALKDLGNTEMSLAHHVGMFTGSRIQAALTLRLKHVRLELPDDVAEVRIPVGPGTGIDTKNSKRMSIFMPRWLYERLRVYSYSPRAAIRQGRAGGDFDNQYLFLTNRGAPMYEARDGRAEFDETAEARYAKEGQVVRQFITDAVIPRVSAKLGRAFKYRYHDLRATYGMNLTDSQLQLVAQGKITLHQAREFVKVRMGHESSATTDLYLQYRPHRAQVRQVVEAHEGHLHNLTVMALEGRL